MILTLLPSLTASGAMTQEPPAAPPPTAPGGTPAQEAVATQPYVLSLQDATKAALENNLDMVVRAYDPLRSEALVIAAESSFDPLLIGTATSSNRQRLTLTPNSFVQSSKNHELNVAFEDPTLTGGRYRIEADALDNAGVTLINPFSNEWDTSWKVSITQPLLRNFGVRASKTLIVQARNTLGISQSRFRQTVIDTLSASEKAYWDLNFALMNLKTSRAALQLAQDFLEQNRIKVRVGTLAPIEITQAEAQVADREEAVIIAENQVRTAEDALRSVMNVPKDSPVWSQSIQPSDPLPLIETTPDMEMSVSSALEHRPDLEQARLDLKSKETGLAYRRNQRRWGLDLSGDYGKVGIGFDEILRDSAGDPILDPVTGKPIITSHGSYGDSLDDLRRGANLDWRVSMMLGIPIGNRQAIANFTDSEYAVTQAQKGLETLELAARVQVRDAVRTVQTTLKRVKAAQVNVRLQKEKLSAEQKKFENGMSTSFQVLQFQTDLFQAESRENLAMVDYDKAQVELERVQGTLLEARRVTMPSGESLRTVPYRPKTKVREAPGGSFEPAGASWSAGGLPDRFVFDGRRLVASGTRSGEPPAESTSGPDRPAAP
jgi:outer membrane protein TolC